ncbi:zinc/manganese transport system permease protein [Actinacidiphila yanglinensis]|uniref:Zinc/manganese transport system permease protein n=1 Tax=Actinacidiphila yanglinensis TaxID=310779 RepID=A0A1H5ZZU0_9ACTN|nr:metal ABC transporter permease [Actinacidiphila yanglinensis]SEG41295.1 zinc/manganese transport system permease protein [Actinacidiphila yanglinensis]
MTAPVRAAALARAHSPGAALDQLAAGPLSHPYFQHALLAGTAIAAACGLVGYFLVLRAQVFTGDALSHTAFTGALGALALGYDLRLGLYATCVVVALLLGTLGSGAKADDVAIGSLFSWTLGMGVFFLTVYTTTRSTANGGAGTSVLFGSIFGLSSGQAWLAAAVGAAVCAALLALARPLLFASIDPDVAAARGLPVRALGYGFLVLVGVCAAEATQAIGSLLLLGLLAAPAGAAHRLTDRPYRALALAPILAVAEVVAGLGLGYAVPDLPPSFAVVATATAVYAAAYTVRPVAAAHARRTGRRRPADLPVFPLTDTGNPDRTTPSIRR